MHNQSQISVDSQSETNSSDSEQENSSPSNQIIRKVNKEKQTNSLCYKLWAFIPWFAIILTLCQIVVYMLPNKNVYNTFLLIAGKVVKDFQYWRIFTYQFIHLDKKHLSMNCFMQILLFWPLEIEQGIWRLRVLIVQSGSVMIAGIVLCYLNPKLHLAGASAGVYGLLASHLIHMTFNYSKLKYLKFRITTVLFLFIIDIGVAIYTTFITDVVDSSISHLSHFIGGGAGLILSLICYRRIEENQTIGCSGYLLKRNTHLPY